MKDELFEYKKILARLQGAIQGIINNLELPDPLVKLATKRLKAALKLSDESIKNLK